VCLFGKTTHDHKRVGIRANASTHTHTHTHTLQSEAVSVDRSEQEGETGRRVNSKVCVRKNLGKSVCACLFKSDELLELSGKILLSVQ